MTAGTTGAPRFEGRAFRLGGDEYILPPLALKATKELHAKIVQFRESADPTDPAVLDLMLDVVHAAMKRNYPDIARAELEELLDLGNIGPVFKTVLGQSGYAPTSEGAQGNASGPPAAP